MKCPKCGKEWDVSSKITSSTYICAYCGETIDSYGQSKKDLGAIILELKNIYGDDLVEDYARLNALLMDYAPEMAKERKLIINALKEGILTQLRRGLEVDEIDSVIRKCTSYLVTEMWITETAAKYAVTAISYALGIDIPTISNTDNIEDESSSINAANDQLIKGDACFGAVVGANELADYSSIGYKAFASNMQLEEIVIPENIKKIYPKAFIDCSSLKRVKLNKNIVAIGKGVFDGCIKLESVQIDSNPNYTVSRGQLIDKNKKELLRSVNSGEASVNIINGVNTVCKKAFERSNVEQITIPNSIEKIEEEAFYLTMNLQRIIVENGNQKYRSFDGVLHSRDGKTLIRYPQGKKDVAYYLEDSVIEIGKKAFSCAIALNSITFAGQLKTISENAFEYCVGIENLMLPRNVEIIGERAFQYCEKLGSIMLPQGIVKIGDCAFIGCKLLNSVSVPKSVTSIGNMAFYGCKELKKVVIQNGVKFIGDRAFAECPNVEITIIGNEFAETYCRLHDIKYNKA